MIGADRSIWSLSMGATRLADGAASFQVWAPRCERIDLLLESCANPRRVEMDRGEDRVFKVTLEDAPVGCRYMYLLHGAIKRPDPVSRYQPEGVHGPSELVDPRGYPWGDQAWRGLTMKELIMYELHVGTFTTEGTFAAVISYLPYLCEELGITAVELMPVVEFPGRRGWGYDGVHLYAPHSGYGGPDSLKTLVDACHRTGLAVVLDVVYNHLGPEGNYLREFGPYFTNRHRTPWGDAVNFDGEDAAMVRRYIIENALYWITEYHVDALRLDAIHGIVDESPVHILKELNDAVQAQANLLGRTVPVIAESNLNDAKVITAVDEGGYGLAGQWNEDFHHSVHAYLTGERDGYYVDFGRLEDISKALSHGFVYEGQYSAFRRRPHGTRARHVPGDRFVAFVQNHDQVGNRAMGERLVALTSLEALKLAAAFVLWSPYVPLLFMGEEYGEPAPFFYFTSFSDGALAEAVRKGRREEFATFTWKADVPDPQDPGTFQASTLHLRLKSEPKHRELLAFYRALIHLRKTHPSLGSVERKYQIVRTLSGDEVLFIYRAIPQGEESVAVFHFGAEPRKATIPIPRGRWLTLLDSAAKEWGGPEGCMSPREAIESSGVLEVGVRPYHVLGFLRDLAVCSDPPEKRTEKDSVNAGAC
ncbi:MAG: malto-oligosyltrehalose trehalohydrolase [bacterium]|uniref:Malto-oligosyltrehalose trehalohydrolase n=1 Tax=Candidatus Methylomirabilis tolerans TaxID=3123416 RepID=A0AAJ1AIZ4_9BACT|nr:malto-oligosyltrehalose trehalohydrolase [Candidatus Methylomirabilis sp.]